MVVVGRRKRRDLLAALLLVMLSTAPHAFGGGLILGDHSRKDGKDGVYGLDDEGLLTLNAEVDDYAYLFPDASGTSPCSSLLEGEEGVIRLDKALLSCSLDSALRAKAEKAYGEEGARDLPLDGEAEAEEDDKAAGKEEEGAEGPSKAVDIGGARPRPASAAMLLGSPEDTHKERLRKLRAFLADEAEMERITQRRRHARQQRLWEEEEARQLAAGEDPNTAVLHDCFLSLVEHHTEAEEAWGILRNRKYDPARNGYEGLRRACALDRAAIVEALLLHPAVQPGEVPGDLLAECYAAGSYATMAVLVRDDRLPLAPGLFKALCDKPAASGLLGVVLRNPRFQTAGHTRKAMVAATERGDTALLRFLLEEVGARPSKKALMAAIYANQLEAFRLLLAQPGLNPAAFGNAALFEASRRGLEAMTRELLAHPLVAVKLSDNIAAAIRAFHAFKHPAITRAWVNEAHIFQPIGWEAIRFPHPTATTLEAAAESDEDAPPLTILRHILPALPFLSLSPRLQSVIDCLAQGAPKDALIAFIAERVWMHDQQPFIRDALLDALREVRRQADAAGDHPTFVAIRETGLLD
jgi:hypothetical protein